MKSRNHARTIIRIFGRKATRDRGKEDMAERERSRTPSRSIDRKAPIASRSFDRGPDHRRSGWASDVTVVRMKLEIQVECPAGKLDGNSIGDVNIDVSDRNRLGRGIKHRVERIDAGFV